MSKWQDWGFPNNLYYVKPYYVVAGLRNALTERIGGTWKDEDLLLNIAYQPSVNSPMHTVDRLIWNALSHTGLQNELLIVHDQKYKSVKKGYATDAEVTAALDNLCIQLGFLDKPFEFFSTPKYSVKWALSRYRIINYITKRNMSGLFVKIVQDEYGYNAGFIQRYSVDRQVSSQTDGYFAANTMSDTVAGCLNRMTLNGNSEINSPMDISGAVITYYYNKDSRYPNYDPFNSGMKNGDALFFNAKGFNADSEFDIIGEGFFSLPSPWKAGAIQALRFHTMQIATEIDSEDLAALDIYLIGDMTPYLEYYDEYGDQEVPPIPEIPDFPEPPGEGGGGGGDDDDDDDDDKPDDPQDPYPDLDLNAYVVICRHVYEGDKKEVIQKQYAIVRYGYVSSRLPAEYKHIAWYPLYTERVYQRPPDYPIWQWEYCFIKTDLGHKDNLELLESWAQATLEPQGYRRAYF